MFRITQIDYVCFFKYHCFEVNVMNNTISLKDKVVLITGGASGAGLTYVKEFSKTGCDIAFTYNNSSSAAEKLVENLKQEKTNIKAYALNLNSVNDIKETLEKIVKDFKKIDVLVNNAGIYPSKNIDEITEDDWDNMLDINTKATFFLNREVASIMNKNDGGSIINISSINATNPNKNLVHYGTSKKAVEMISSSLAVCLGPSVRVNCIAPGLINRENIEKFIPNWVESYKERSPLHRLVEPKDIANTCIFLASDLSSAITGQTITVDCGITLTPCFNNED